MNIQGFFLSKKLFLINVILVSVMAGFVIAMVAFSCSTPIGPSQTALAQEVPAPRIVASDGLQSSFSHVARTVLPVVVEIRVLEQITADGGRTSPFDFFFGPRRGDRGTLPVPSVGSGVIVDEDGGKYYVVTNDHVAGAADEITVALSDGKEYEATLEGKDPRKDLAVVSFAARRGDIPVAVLGNSDELEVGDWVLAVGNPFGFTSTVTAGIVSAKERSGPRENISDFIQTDAAINQGNSGGPLVNLRGEVVGINTWISTDTGVNIGLGFAIPINNAKKTIRDIIAIGEVEYGWLGVEIADIPDVVAEQMRYMNDGGAIVFQIFGDSPADVGGVHPGDIVLELNGSEIRDYMHLVRLVGDLEPGQPAVFRIWRLGELVNLTAVIGVRGDVDTVEQANREMWPGISVYPLTEEVRAQMEDDGPKKGVYVQEVKPGTPPEKAGLELLDVITAINGNPVENLVDFFEIMNDTESRAYEMNVVRDGLELVIGVEYR